MTIKTMWAALLLVVAAAVVAPGAQARPPFKEKEGVTCKYCHQPSPPTLNYRAIFYRTHKYSFAGFDDAAEAKKAGVEVAPFGELKPKSLTPAFKPVYPGPGTVVFGDTPDGVVVDGKPSQSGWKSLFNGKSLKGWVAEKGYWSVVDGAIVGDKKGETPHHHYLFSDKDYSDFELHIDVKMDGYNSGVCARIQPKSFDDVPGYQVDMGEGYWGCLWDEHHRQTKIFDFPQNYADAIVRKGDWNHYYVRMVGTHITIFLNGVKTAEGDDPGGFASGPLGFQLCHGANTVASFKNIYIKALKKPTKGTAPLRDDKPQP